MRLEPQLSSGEAPEPRLPHWLLNLYPRAAEAGGCLRLPPRGRAKAEGEAAEPERSGEEALRRARTKIRRYCAANRLNRLGTLTYGGSGCHDPFELRADVAAFFRGLRQGLDEAALPYLWVPEWHPGGHGLHVHFALGRYVPQTLIRDTWGHGFVHIKLLGDLPVGSGSLEEARLSAWYLSKYVGKAIEQERIPGLHRYEVAQGFQPEAIPLHGRYAEDVIAHASVVMGRAPSLVWRSSVEEGWRGPPACWLAWSD